MPTRKTTIEASPTNIDAILVQQEKSFSGVERKALRAYLSSTAGAGNSSLHPEVQRRADSIRDALGLVLPSSINNKPDLRSPEQIEGTQNAEGFIRQFVTLNTRLPMEAKKFLASVARTKEGPWSIEGHVTDVHMDREKIVVELSNGEAYYHLPNDLQNFISEFILDNKSLTPEVQEFMKNLVFKERGPWSLKGHVTNVCMAGEKIVVTTRDGEAYYHLPNNPRDFIDEFITNSNRLLPADKIFLTQKVRSEKGPWSYRGNVKSVGMNGSAIVVSTLDNCDLYYYPNEVAQLN